MDDLVLGLIVGFVAATLLLSGVMFLVIRRLRARQEAEIQRFDESILDLRQERAEDKETNRRLRHELVAQSPDRLVETATTASFERDQAVSERDQAVEQLNLVKQDLTMANSRIADREAKLRQYREALREIRISLEAQDRTRSVNAADGLIDTDTDEVPAEALAQAEQERADLSAAE